MPMQDSWVVVGLDNGGNKNNATVLDPSRRLPRGRDGRDAEPRAGRPRGRRWTALVQAFEGILERTGVAGAGCGPSGLDTPGPASADGVISSRGSTNFAHPGWRGFDFRGALEARLGLPVVYNNDGNAAALYAHHVCFGAEAGPPLLDLGHRGHRPRRRRHRVGPHRQGRGRDGGRAGPRPHPDGGAPGRGTAAPPLQLRLRRRRRERRLAHRHREEPAALLAHPLPGPRARPGRVAREGREARPLVRREGRPPGARRSSSSRPWPSDGSSRSPPTSPTRAPTSSAAASSRRRPQFREWFLAKVREHTTLREEQARVVRFALVPDLDMAGARGAALAALESLRER